jgi:hypothetical protein
MNEITLKEGYYIKWARRDIGIVPRLKKRRRFWFDKVVASLPANESMYWYNRSTFDEIAEVSNEALKIWVKRQQSFGLITEGVNINKS